METIGICAGSFDPITNGHVWLIEKSAALVDKLYVAVGVNPSKKYTFNDTNRLGMVHDVLIGSLSQSLFSRIEVIELKNELLINKAIELNATHLVRGIRDTKDFEYERQVQLVNSKIAPHIESVFLITPPQLSEVSSSTVKGLVGYKGWEDIVKQYVHPVVFNAFVSMQNGTHKQKME